MITMVILVLFLVALIYPILKLFGFDEDTAIHIAMFLVIVIGPGVLYVIMCSLPTALPR